MICSFGGCSNLRYDRLCLFNVLVLLLPEKLVKLKKKETSAGREVSHIAAWRTGKIKGVEVLLPEEQVEFEEDQKQKYAKNQAENVELNMNRH